MDTLANLWTFSLITSDPLRCGPCYVLFTERHKVEVYKSRDDARYHVCITDIKTGKRRYESRYDQFYHGATNPHAAQDTALAKLSRFSL